MAVKRVASGYMTDDCSLAFFFILVHLVVKVLFKAEAMNLTALSLNVLYTSCQNDIIESDE